MKQFISHLLALLGLVLSSFVQASTLTPNVLPLVVRNPYLSTWMQKAREEPWHYGPIFWNGNPIGMSIMAYVPKTKTVFPLLGTPQHQLDTTGSSGYKVAYPTYNGAQFDSSTTNLTYQIPGTSDYSPVTLTVSFLSPITPTSILRQSIPASYVSFTAQGHSDIYLYMDLNGAWVSGDPSNVIEWASGTTNGVTFLNVTRQSPQLFHEDFIGTNGIQAEWGRLLFLAKKPTAFAFASVSEMRSTFAKTGRLPTKSNFTFRAINDDEPVSAFQQNLALSKTGSASALFTIAFIQDDIAQFAETSPSDYIVQHPLWLSQYSGVDMLSFHYNDFSNAKSLADAYSAQLNSDASGIGGSDYSDIVALSARQVMGGVQISGSADSPLIFLKEISSDGNAQTTDVIFPSMPFFVYTNPTWLSYLLEPLLAYQQSGQWPHKWAIHDLGTNYPNLTGHPNGIAEQMPIEESGDMLIMTLAYVNAIGSSASGFVSKYYDLYRQWANYLVGNTLRPDYQLSTDDFAGRISLQSNLALKGIVALQGMSKLSQIVGNTTDETHYKNVARDYIGKWQGFALETNGSFTYSKLAYNITGSWTTLYSLFANSLLCLNSDDGDFIPAGIYANQSAWYTQVLHKYAVPLDDRHLYAKTDWTMEAASVATPQLRQQMINHLGLWVNQNTIDRPFSDLISSVYKGYGGGIMFMARPVVGGHFAALALQTTSCGIPNTGGDESVRRSADDGRNVEERRGRVGRQEDSQL